VIFSKKQLVEMLLPLCFFPLFAHYDSGRENSFPGSQLCRNKECLFKRRSGCHFHNLSRP